MLIFLFIFLVVLFILVHDSDVDGFAIFCLLCILSGSFLFSHISHSRDLGTIRAQQGVIDVYTTRVAELKTTLSEAVRTETKEGVVFNADSPYRSLIEALTQAQTELANAQKERAEAVKSIEQRKAGPFWFVVSLTAEK